MADALGTGGGVVSAVDHRLDQGGMLAAQGPTALDIRTGVLYGPGSTALVTGTSATGTMTVSIAAHHWVTTRATADGVYVGTKEAAGTVNIAAAPGANSRIDVVYVKQNDAGSSVTPDGSTAEAYGVVTGTAAASPTKPALPVGATELATVQIAAGTTSTNGAGATITNTARQTVARGCRIPVRTQAERDLLTKCPDLEVYRIDTGQRQVTDGSSWSTIGDLPLAYVRATTTQSIPTDVWTALNFQAADLNPDSMWASGAPSRLTAAKKGIYRITAVAAFTTSGASSRTGCQIQKNGVALPAGTANYPPGVLTSGIGAPSPSVLVQLNVGDYVTAAAAHSAGGPLNTQVAVDTASFLCAECVRLLP